MTYRRMKIEYIIAHHNLVLLFHQQWFVWPENGYDSYLWYKSQVIYTHSRRSFVVKKDDVNHSKRKKHDRACLKTNYTKRAIHKSIPFDNHTSFVLTNHTFSVCWFTVIFDADSMSCMTMVNKIKRFKGMRIWDLNNAASFMR